MFVFSGWHKSITEMWKYECWCVNKSHGMKTGKCLGQNGGKKIFKKKEKKKTLFLCWLEVIFPLLAQVQTGEDQSSRFSLRLSDNKAWCLRGMFLSWNARLTCLRYLKHCFRESEAGYQTEAGSSLRQSRVAGCKTAFPSLNPSPDASPMSLFNLTFGICFPVQSAIGKLPQKPACQMQNPNLVENLKMSSFKCIY